MIGAYGRQRIATRPGIPLIQGRLSVNRSDCANVVPARGAKVILSS